LRPKGGEVGYYTPTVCANYWQRFGVMQTVRDKATGVQLAWIEDGKVFDAKTRAMVGIIRNGKVFRLNGVFVCHVASLRETGETPDAFKRLLEEED
jgi:hypothetical protein